MQSATLRQALSGHMLDLNTSGTNLGEMQAITHRAAQQMRSAGFFDVQTPNVSGHRDAFDFLKRQMATLDSLPPGDKRRAALVDAEVRSERSSVNPYEKR